MSRFNITKKLVPVKRAWKSFKTTLQPKLHKLDISKAIKIGKAYTTSALKRIWVAILFRLHALTRRYPAPTHRDLRCHENKHMENFSAIYIDELFQRNHLRSEQASGAGHKRHDDMTSLAEPTMAKQMVASTSCVNEGRSYDDFGKQQETGDKGVARTQLKNRFRGVDERAEEFISKFRQEMKLESEKSIIDFQEMLKRSA